MNTIASIPQALHQVWLGPARLADHLIDWARSWRRFMPHWSATLWVDDVERFSRVHEGMDLPWDLVEEVPPLVNLWAYRDIAKAVGERAAWAARSDIARIEIIARHGGVYADLDMELFAPIDALLAGVRLFVADEWGQVCGNFLFGASPNHPALWTAVRELDDSLRPIGFTRTLRDRLLLSPGTPTHRGILELTGPGYLARKIQRHPDCVVFPWRIFSPLHPRADARKVRAWPECSLGNHHFTGTWYDQTKVTPDQDLNAGVPAAQIGQRRRGIVERFAESVAVRLKGAVS